MPAPDAAGAAPSACREPAGSDGDGGWGAAAQLQHHWERLDDARKALYAQMAVVVRWAPQRRSRAAAAAAAPSAAQAPR